MLLFITTFSFGQSSVFSRIVIKATTSVVDREYFVDICLNIDSLKVIYKQKDSISSFVVNDPAVVDSRKFIIKLLERSSAKTDTLIKAVNKLDSLYHLYTFYSVDSIQVPNAMAKDFVDLVRRVFSTSYKELEDEAGNKNRAVFDGTRMTYTLIDRNSIRKVHAHSPTLKSHPLLASLIIQSLNLYRERKKNDFLNKRSTSGY